MSDVLVHWQRFVGALSPDAALRPAILESWGRSRAAGVDPEPTRMTLRCVPDEELRRRLADNAELIELARPHLEWISAAHASVPHVAYLVDRDGIVLHSTGEAEAVRTVGRAGFDWSEATAGTNGAGTALVAGVPVAVEGAEHFARALHGYTCTGAPVHGPTGEVVGAIDVSTAAGDASPDRLLVVAHAAYTVGRELRYRHALRRADARLEAERRLAFLAEASALLASSLDYETTLERLVSLAVPTLADWAAYNVDGGDGTVRTVTIHHPDPAMEALAHEIDRRYPIRADDGAGVARVLRTGEPELIPDIPDSVLESVAHDAEHLRMLRSLGFRSLINVPLVAHGRVLGALAFATGDSGRRLGPRDLDLAVELARRAAVAVEHTRLYADAQAARREAEAANRAKSEFLGTMSHELRTPLNAISGYAELLDLEIRGPLTDAQRQDLARIRRNSQYLLSLINDVLNFARLGAGRVEMRIADVRLAEVIAGLEALVAPQVHAKGLSYEPGVHDPALAARADPERLQQVLLNLLTNAIKFTDAGGRIVLSCEAATDAVRVRVRDTGRGVPADELGRIFEPFVQVDRHPTHGSQQGVGLGLAISRELARAMGGEITVESTVGAGSTFTLTLPRPAGAAR